MKFQNHAVCDNIIIGKPRTLANIKYIPVFEANIFAVNEFGFFLVGTISPMAIIVLDKTGEINFFTISTDRCSSAFNEKIISALNVE